MTATATRRRRTKSQPPAEAAVTTAPALSEYCAIEVRISWFSTQKQVKGGKADVMAAAADADVGALSISKRLMDSKHPLVKACSAARRELDRIVNKFTIPKIAVSRAAVGEAARYRQERDAGVRLIRKDLVETFYSELRTAEAVLDEAVLALHNGMEEIRTHEQQRLRGLFNPQDYAVDVRTAVAVNVRLVPTQIDVDLRKLCPALYESEAQKAAAERQLAVQAFAEDFAGRMAAYVQQFARQLGTRRRVKVPPDGADARYQDAELVDLHSSDGGDPLLSTEPVTATLQPVDGKATDRVVMTLPNGAAFRQRFTIYLTEERRQVKADTVQHLKEMFDEFFTKQDAFGAHRDEVAAGVGRARDILSAAAADLDATAIANRVRTDSGLRGSVARALTSLGETLEAGVETVRAGRRAVLRNLQLDAAVEIES